MKREIRSCTRVLHSQNVYSTDSIPKNIVYLYTSNNNVFVLLIILLSHSFYCLLFMHATFFIYNCIALHIHTLLCEISVYYHAKMFTVLTLFPGKKTLFTYMRLRRKMCLSIFLPSATARDPIKICFDFLSCGTLQKYISEPFVVVLTSDQLSLHCSL